MAEPSVFTGTADVVAVLALLAAFAMLRAQLLGSQMRLYAAQSTLVALLAAAIGAEKHLVVMFVLAVLSFLLKAVLVPALMRRFLRDADIDLAHSARVRAASGALIALGVAAVGLFAIRNLTIAGAALPTAALAVSLAVVLVSLLLIIFRSDVVSQSTGVFSLENGVSIASLVVAWGLPLILAVVLLFDVLVVVVVFGVLARVHHERSETLSTDVLDRLRG